MVKQDDIAKRKGLRYREDILDNMGSDELIDNLFRISQTEQKLKREDIKTESDANKAHYIVGKNIREVIEKNGGIMPEELPTPKKSLKRKKKTRKNRNEINLDFSYFPTTKEERQALWEVITIDYDNLDIDDVLTPNEKVEARFGIFYESYADSLKLKLKWI